MTDEAQINAALSTAGHASLDETRPVLIAGPTASGKSALALWIAERFGGVIVNADAIQVYENWDVLTARPPAGDLAAAEHLLYGHVARDTAYSTGHWLRDVRAILGRGQRPIIVGGTGLYFTALTEGLAEIPETPPEIRAEGDALRRQGLAQMLAVLDADTLGRIDQQNPMRVQRAWEVQRTTGKGLAAWHDATPSPDVPLSHCTPILLDCSKNWLNERIARRFQIMLEHGALEEARANLPFETAGWPSLKAIGAPELFAHLRGETTLAEAADLATIASRQYAKRQRTWFRARMKSWARVDPATL